jgi:inosine-uridine nucleoside N-ribohydrolase
MTHATTPLIVDTDAGFDDFLAITYLLASGAPIEAFTLVNGISDVDEGARALLLLQEKAGLKTPIPIYKGSRQPMAGTNQFPDMWRHQATEIIKDLHWGEPTGTIGTPGAVEFLVQRLANPAKPARILAIGPLSNLGRTLQKAPASAKAIAGLTIMGGAVGVQGNIPPVLAAEGNVYVDPLAAQTVFESSIGPTLVTLNDANKVRITKPFIDGFNPPGTLGGIAKAILDIIEKKFIGPGQPAYDAWDPMAAVSLGTPSVLEHIEHIDVEVVQCGAIVGMTVQAYGKPNVHMAKSASAAIFKQAYTAGFGAGSAAG